MAESGIIITQDIIDNNRNGNNSNGSLPEAGHQAKETREQLSQKDIFADKVVKAVKFEGIDHWEQKAEAIAEVTKALYPILTDEAKVKFRKYGYHRMSLECEGTDDYQASQSDLHSAEGEHPNSNTKRKRLGIR